MTYEGLLSSKRELFLGNSLRMKRRLSMHHKSRRKKFCNYGERLDFLFHSRVFLAQVFPHQGMVSDGEYNLAYRVVLVGSGVGRRLLFGRGSF